jgi:adenosine deaminase
MRTRQHALRPLAVLAAFLLASGALADERSTARRFAEARRDEPSLIAFLRAMPKGADLHNHVGGSLFPEDGLRVAVRDGLFFDPATNTFRATQTAGSVPASRLLRDDGLRNQFFNASTARGYAPGPAGGHDHFFDAFGPLNSPWSKASGAEALASVVRRARLQNLQYLELMMDPGGEALGRVMSAAPVDASPAEMLEKLKPRMDDYVTAAKAEMDEWDREVARQIRMAPPLSAADRPITVRYLVTAYRTQPDRTIFAKWAAAFALMRADRRLVGVNFAAPEDDPTSQARFDPQMQLLDFLWRRFERPNITLHAGELNLYLSPLEDMTYHIRRSIEVGHARRIGHGTAVAWEDDCPGLLRKMRDEGIAVEICPTSEAIIQNAEGDRHPFSLYRRAGVPLTPNTDDEAVCRSNLTMEFVRAARSWSLSYADLKDLARNSIEYSFLPGESLFERHDYRRPRAPFRRLPEDGWTPTPEEAKQLAASDKATVQARLERAFVEFERRASSGDRRSRIGSGHQEFSIR